MFQASTFAENAAGELFIVKYGEPPMIYQLPCPDCTIVNDATEPDTPVPPIAPLLPSPSGNCQRLSTSYIAFSHYKVICIRQTVASDIDEAFDVQR
jgi:hypothetical protein